MAYAGLTAPPGFLECDGSEASKSQYPNLANVLGTRFGTAAAGKFKLPNAEEAAIMGAGGTRVAGVGTAIGRSIRGEHHLAHDRRISPSMITRSTPSCSEEDPGHVHDITSVYPNFGIRVPDNWVTGTGGGSGASFGQIDERGTVSMDAIGYQR